MSRFALSFLLLLAGICQAELRSYQLQHRSADTIIPVLQGLVDQDGAISGQGQLLVIRSSSNTLEQLESLLEELDRPLQNLLISVRLGADAVNAGSGVDWQQSTSSDSAGKQAGIHQIFSTRGRQAERSIRSVDGGTVRFSDGKLLALPSGNYWGPGISYQEIQSGYLVRARLAGDRVQLDVSARNDRHENEQIYTGAVDTHLSGGLGEWLFLGGVESSTRESGQSTSTLYRSHGRGSDSLYIKVELLAN